MRRRRVALCCRLATEHHSADALPFLCLAQSTRLAGRRTRPAADSLAPRPTAAFRCAPQALARDDWFSDRTRCRVHRQILTHTDSAGQVVGSGGERVRCASCVEPCNRAAGGAAQGAGWRAESFAAHQIGVNCVAWAPQEVRLVARAALSRSAAPRSTQFAENDATQRIASGGCDNVVRIWVLGAVRTFASPSRRHRTFSTFDVKRRRATNGSANTSWRCTATGCAMWPGRRYVVRRCLVRDRVDALTARAAAHGRLECAHAGVGGAGRFGRHLDAGRRRRRCRVVGARR